MEINESANKGATKVLPIQSALGTVRRESRGERTRSEILAQAVYVASEEGLEGLTIGHLARSLSMSKSGLFAHFGSKQDLQLATIDAARSLFIHLIVNPSRAASPGLARLATMLEAWLRYVEGSVFPGGCFFAAASAEFDGRPGPVRDQIATATKSWLDALADEAGEAQLKSEIKPSVDELQLAFEVHALVQEANWACQLLGDKNVFARARSGIRERMERAATRKGLTVLKSIENEVRNSLNHPIEK
jgi:AcrR family transcriptional regulator